MDRRLAVLAALLPGLGGAATRLMPGFRSRRLRTEPATHGGMGWSASTRAVSSFGAAGDHAPQFREG